VRRRLDPREKVVRDLFASYARLEHQLRDHLRELPELDRRRFAALHVGLLEDVFGLKVPHDEAS
jgi:hypothetical protein